MDLGRVTNGSFKLEIGYTDFNGAKGVCCSSASYDAFNVQSMQVQCMRCNCMLDDAAAMLIFLRNGYHYFAHVYVAGSKWQY